MWNLQQTTGQPPSKTLRISDFAGRVTGMPDMWTALCFDSAVLAFGRYIENKLHELDDDHKPVHTLRELLSDETAEQRNERLLEMIMATPHMQSKVVTLN